MISVYFSRRDSYIYLVNDENGRIMKILSGLYGCADYRWLFGWLEEGEFFEIAFYLRELENLWDFYGEVMFGALSLVNYYDEHLIDLYIVDRMDFLGFRCCDGSSFINDVFNDVNRFYGLRTSVDKRLGNGRYVKLSYFLGKDIGSDWMQGGDKID
jgi:hypothetical protein